MPVDWNDRDAVKQALIKARNAGVSDEDFAAYAKEKRASLAGTTLKSRQDEIALSNQSPILTSRLAEMGSFPTSKGVHVPHAEETLPYVFGAPGQAAKELVDRLQATSEGKEPPALTEALTRIGIQAAIPKALELGARGLGKTVGFAGPAMQRVLASTPIQAAKTLYGKVAPEALEQAGTAIATGTKKLLGRLQPSALAKDAYVEGLNNQGIKIPMQKLIGSIRNAIPEAQTIGSDMMGQARSTLLRIADDVENSAQNGSMGIGDFVTFKENIGRQLFKSTNPALRGVLKTLSDMADNHIAQEAGPAVANHIGALEQATANRLSVLRKVNKLFSRDPEGAVNKFMQKESIQRAMNELDAQTGSNHAEELAQIAAKKSFTPQDKHIIADRLTRLAGSTMVGHALGGPEGLMTYLLTSPGLRRQAAKLGLLLSTTSIPRLATSAVTQALSNPNEDNQ